MIEKPVRLVVMTAIKTKGVDRGGRACAIPELELPCAIHVCRRRSGSRRGRRRDGNVDSIRLIADRYQSVGAIGRRTDLIVSEETQEITPPAPLTFDVSCTCRLDPE